MGHNGVLEQLGPLAGVLGIAARYGQPISFWTFTKYGLVVASTTIVIAWANVALRYFAVA